MQFLNRLVVSLSWLALGKPAIAPRRIHEGVPLTVEQQAHVQNLAWSSSAWDLASPVSLSDLGRASSKYDHAFRQISHLESDAAVLQGQLDPYGILSLEPLLPVGPEPPQRSRLGKTPVFLLCRLLT